MAKRIDQAALTFSVGHIPRGLVSVGTGGSGGLQNAVDVVDSKHHLKSRLGHMLTISKFAHDHLRALAVDTELRTMGVSDTDMLDQPEHVDIPGGRPAHIGNGQHRDDARPWR